MSFSTRARSLFVCLALLFSFSVQAYEAGDFIIRGGAAYVDPQDDSSLLSANGTDLANTGVSVDGDTQVGITAAYMFTNNIGLELLAATPFTHELSGEGSTLSGLGLDRSIGEVEQLPPTLTVQYYFNNSSIVTPYIGAGVNYTIMLEDDLNSHAQGVLGTDKIELDDSVGLALQVGMDVAITDNLLFNAAVWNIDIDTTAKIDDSVLGDLEVDVDIDPWVYMLGVGYKF